MYMHSVRLDDAQALALGSLELAYVGDAVFELHIRVGLCLGGAKKTSDLHRKAVSIVSASAQARAAEKLLPMLNETEADIFRRGRNSRTNSIPKNADRADYQAATGLEALIGFLFLTGRTERVSELIGAIEE